MAEEIKRSFLGPDEITNYYIATPTADDIRSADWQYSKVFTTALVEGLTTTSEMLDILKQRNIIGPEFEQRSTELTEILNAKIVNLESAKSIEEKRDLAVEVANAREELFSWNQRLNSPLSNTAEQIADDARLEYLTSAMVENEDGSKVWDSYNFYLREKSQALALKARFEIMLYLQGLDSDFLSKTPEAVALKEIENDVISKAEEAVKLSEALKEEENKVNEVEQEKPKVRKTRKDKKVK